MTGPIQQIRWMFAFHDWARPRLLAALRQVDPVERLRSDVIPGGNEDGSLHATVAHILGAEVIWFERWQGNTHARLRGSSDYASLDSLDQEWSELEARRRRWLLELPESDLDVGVRYRSVTRGVMEKFPLWETILHLSNHTSHHRGEAAAALTGLGFPPESVDLIDYMRQGRE